MALTRKFLNSIGLEDAKIDSVIEAHIETVDALKQQIEGYKQQIEAEKAKTEEQKAEAEKARQQIEALQADAGKLSDVQAELDALKKAPDFKAKYEAEKAAFEAYKLESESKAKLERVKAAYRDLLRAENVGAEQVDAILGVTDFTGIELADDGKLNDAEKLSADIKSRWGGFIVKTDVRPSEPPANPPKGNDTPFETMSLSDKMKYANEHPADPAVRAWLTK